MSLRHSLLSAAFRARLFPPLRRIWGAQALTVLAYHRVTDPVQAGFDTFAPNVSATPVHFAAQMDFVARHFNVVSLADAQNWLAGQRPLPLHPLLITFDDGYRDNLEHAFPVLQQHGFPAVIFLATNYIGQKKPFFWDLAAYCFYHTQKDTAVLPLAGPQQWADEKTRSRVMYQWLESLKWLPNAAKETAVQQLPDSLDVAIPADAFARLCLSWDQVRRMAAAGITFGAHTQNHPILTRISLEEAEKEIRGSQARIVNETGQPVTAFAYPNGQAADFNPALQEILQRAGFNAAFTLLPGPTRPAEARRTPFALRRILISHRDDLPRFAAKVMGFTRLTGLPG